MISKIMDDDRLVMAKRAQEQGQLIMRYASLRVSHDRLLAAAKSAAEDLRATGSPYAAQRLFAAIAAADIKLDNE
jgi:hypothetical protein